MDAREFVDELYKVWAQTTEAKAGHWAASQDEGIGTWEIWTHLGNDSLPICDFVDKTDAQFITTMHAAIPELVRMVHETLDENDRIDRERDQVASELFQAGLEIERLQRELEVLRG